MIGTRLGPYELVEEIGKGGMATVYRAYQPGMDRFVAVKVIHRSVAADVSSLERFQREARLVTRLEHPHVLPIYDYNALHNPPFIIMRYLESGTLKDVMEEIRLPLSEVAYMMRQVASALDYAHRQGVVHRDIKPSNIMVDQDGNAFLTDFGVARLMGKSDQSLTVTGFTVGTPGYMSPEQGVGADNIDHRTDIYALGVMLFEMVTGTMPFNADTPMAVIMQHINNPVPDVRQFNAELPLEVNLVITKAMAKHPDDRYETAMDFADALVELLGTSVMSTPAMLRQAAQSSVERIRQHREANQEEIKRTLSLFAQQRAQEGANPYSTILLPNQSYPSPITPSGSYQAAQYITPTPLSTQTFAPPNRWQPLLWLAVGALLVAFAGAAALLFSREQGPTAQMLTQTAVLMLLSETPNVPLVEAVRVVTVRSGPGSLYPALVRLEAGQRLDIIGITEDGSWYQVMLEEGETGWITAAPSSVKGLGPVDGVPIAAAPTGTVTPTDLPTRTPTLTPTATPATPVVRMSRALTVRGGPGSNYPSMSMLEIDEQLDLVGISEDGAWLQVLLADGSRGWVTNSSSLISV